MKLVKPITITDSMVTSCNVPETDYAAWNALTAYVIGNNVIRTTSATHKIYQRVTNGTTATAPESDAVNWVQVSATNRWKMFDTSTGSQTTNPSSISITIVPAAIVNNITLLNLSGSSVTVSMTDPIDGVVYNKTFSTSLGNTIGDWDSYFFDYITRTDTMVVSDLPHYVNASITITVTESGTAKLGVLALGRAIELGGVQSGAKMGITDYSRKEADTFGGYTLVQRAYSKRTSFQLLIPKEITNQVSSLLAEVRATPVVWIGSEEYVGTIVYGFYKDFDITISYPNYCDCTLEIEGMT